MAKLPCAVERAFTAMTTSERIVLEELLLDPTLTAGWIADLLTDEGYPVDRAAVGHFRRKLRAGKASVEFG